MIGQQTTGGGEILDKLAGNGYTYFVIIITLDKIAGNGYTYFVIIITN